MTVMERFIKALQLAAEGHRTQVDKSGEPYIFHLLRVATAVESEFSVVAILHDYFEDVVTVSSVADIQRLAPFLEPWECKSLFAVTRQASETYAEYIDRVKLDVGATQVKLNDLNDHLDTLDSLKSTYSLYERYVRAREVLLEDE